MFDIWFLFIRYFLRAFKYSEYFKSLKILEKTTNICAVQQLLKSRLIFFKYFGYIMSVFLNLMVDGVLDLSIERTSYHNLTIITKTWAPTIFVFQDSWKPTIRYFHVVLHVLQASVYNLHPKETDDSNPLQLWIVKQRQILITLLHLD